MGDLHLKDVRPGSSLAAHLGWSGTALRAIAGSRPGVVLPPVVGPDGTVLIPTSLGVRYRTRTLEAPRDLHAALDVGEKARRMAWAAVQTWRDLRAIELPEDEAAKVHAERRRHLHALALALAMTGTVGANPLDERTRDGLRALLEAGPVRAIDCDAIAHGDLHPANVVLAEGRTYVIDLDNLCPAPAFTDLLYVARWARRDPGSWQEHLDLLATEVGRRPGDADLQMACEILLVQAAELMRRSVPTAGKNLANIADALAFLMGADGPRSPSSA